MTVFVPDSAPVLSLRACVDVCGAAGGTPACATALTFTSNVTTPCSSLASSDSCGLWLGHHRRQFGSRGVFDHCLTTPTAEPDVPVAPPGRFVGSSYGIPGDCCILSVGELYEVPCNYHSDFESAATSLSCLCESPASVSSVADIVSWLDAWTVADLERRRAYLVPAILTCAALALIPWLILCGCRIGSLRGRCAPTARHMGSNEQDDAIGAPSSRLHDASFKAARVHARIKRSMLGLGWTMICSGLVHTVMWPFSGIRGVLEPVLGPYTWSFLFEFGGLLPLMLSIQPIDEYLIHLTALFCFTFLLVFAMLGILLVFLSSSTMGKVAWSIAAGFVWLAALSMVPTLRCDKHGRRVMQPRAILRRLWLVLRVFFLACGLLLVFFGWLLEIALYGEINPTQLGRGFAGVVMFVGWGACSPRNRGRVHRWLGSLGASGTQEQEAAALASLISRGSRGGRGMAEALTMAASSFRVLPLSSLELDDLASNVDTGLNARVRRAHLGDCDAFVSHSWQDDGEQKYRQLEGHAFPSAERTIWLDKACIDQTNIKASLAVLPIYLCSCKELLVLPGPTYATRLWCCMEMFVFVKMGGELERAIILPLSQDTDLLNQLEHFDAGRAQTYLHSDRHRLLATIEASFGTYHPFNEIVRAIFRKKLEVQPLAVATSEVQVEMKLV